MSENELDLKQIKKLLIAYHGDYISVHFVLREFLSWYKSERKKWAMKLLGKEAIKFKTRSLKLISAGYNQCRAEMRKNIEKG